jgi:ACS family glucarate transporter-like MFS transporter
VVWWSLFTALTGAATGFLSLVIARFLFGAGEAGALPNTTGVISRWLPATEISRAIILSFIGQAAGAAIAPLLVVPVAMAFGWRSVFFLNGAIGLLWVMICIRWFRNEPSEMKGISEEEKKLIEENRQYTSHKINIPWRNIFKSRTLLAISLAHFCSQWGNYFFIAWLPVFLQQGRHFSESSMKFVVSFVFLPAIAMSFFCGSFADRLVKKKGLKFGRRFVGVLSLGVLSLSFLIEATTANDTLLVSCLFIGYIFQIFFGTTSFGVCIDISGNHSGVVTGIMNSVGQVGAFFMAIAFGKIVDVTHNFNMPLYVIAGLTFLGAMLCLTIDPNKKLVFGNSVSGNSFN